MSARSERTYYQLQLAAQAMRKATDRALVGSGLTTAQTGTLIVIGAEEPVTQRVVAERLGLRESAVTAMVKRLDELGFVRRTLDESDGRVRILSVSRSGREALTAADKAFAEINSVIESVLTEEELATFSHQLKLVAAAYRPEAASLGPEGTD